MGEPFAYPAMDIPIAQRNIPENTMSSVCKHKKFFKSLRGSTTDLRFDICPAVFNGKLESYSCVGGVHNTNVKMMRNVVFASSSGIIAGEIPEDELKSSIKNVEAVKKVHKEISIMPPPSKEQSLTFVFNGYGKNKTITVDRAFALYHCKALNGIMEAEQNISDAGGDSVIRDRNTVNMKFVEYDTIKHIFLILYNPGTYFTEQLSCVRLLRGGRFNRVLHACNMLEIHNAKRIIQNSMMTLFDLYNEIRVYWSMGVNHIMSKYCRNTRIMAFPDDHVEEEISPDVHELVEKIKQRKNIAAKFEIIGLAGIFSTINEFMPETTTIFAEKIIGIKSILNPGKLDHDIRAMARSEFLELIELVKPSHETSIKLIKAILSEIDTPHDYMPRLGMPY